MTGRWRNRSRVSKFLYKIGFQILFCKECISNVSSVRGAIFENWVVAEIIKQHVNVGRRPDLYFWRDNIGNELDLLHELGGRRQVVEIKAGVTLGTDQFKGLRYY